jgi:3-hydroxy-9,10-secoandrosta-1,3,5(10)-triene-9,17-dione monooxygenase reductase component
MDDLEARGLIVSREPANGVVSDTTFDLTDAGLDVFEQFRRASVQVQAGMESLLGVPETVALRALLYRFTGKIDTGSPVAWL